jgi:hypothetical protein
MFTIYLSTNLANSQRTQQPPQLRPGRGANGARHGEKKNGAEMEAKRRRGAAKREGRYICPDLIYGRYIYIRYKWIFY